MKTRCSTLCVAAVVVAALAVPASGNGRFPRSVKVVFRPGSTSELMLGVTFGLLVSRDDGASWRWICESAVGFAGTYDPDYEYTPTGAIFATTFDGLQFTRDGCHWNTAPAPLGTWFVSSIGIGPDGTIWAGTSDPLLGSAIYKSTDDGVSFQPTAALGQAGDWWESIDVAPSDPQRVYVTGFRLASGQPRRRLLFRSSDGGQSWQELPVTAFVGTNNSDLQIAAISPTDADLVFIRMTLVGSALEEAIYRTADGGAALPAGPTWTKVLDITDNIPGVTVRTSGEVWVTTPFNGVHRSTDGGQTFQQVTGVSYEGWCLSERPGDQTLFLCANDLPPDDSALSRSTTGTAGTWTSALHYRDIDGPERCPDGTLQKIDCEDLLWCGLRDQLGISSTEIECIDAGVPVDAGIDGTGPPPPPKSCCGVDGRPGIELVGPLALLVPWPWRRRRRRAVRRA